MVGAVPTMCNRYPNKEIEHIFASKGRPFGCLTSPHIPTPTSTLMDYNLVKDLGLKMYDLQYQKFSYCGHKLRILGKVSISWFDQSEYMPFYFWKKELCVHPQQASDCAWHYTNANDFLITGVYMWGDGPDQLF